MDRSLQHSVQKTQTIYLAGDAQKSTERRGTGSLEFTCLSGGVPRKLRAEYAGAIYHVINRGDRREAIFMDHQIGSRFCALLANEEKWKKIRRE